MNAALRSFPKDLRIAYKQNPLPIHANAMNASKAALAAARQGKFWEMSDLMFSHQKQLDEPRLREYARELGLNMARFEQDYTDPAIARAIQADLDEGRRLGVLGTPTFFLNGKLVPPQGRQIEGLKKLIAAELRDRQLNPGDD